MTPTIYPITPGTDPGNYTQPSPVVETIRIGGLGGLYVNAAYADEEPMHRRPPGRSHQNGTCGYMASLCARCFDLELRWHKRIARQIAAQTPPLPGENYSAAGYLVRSVRLCHMKAHLTFHYPQYDSGPFLVSNETTITPLVRRHEGNFFQKTVGHRRETIEEYEGFLIVSHTRRYSQGQTERVTLIYLFDHTENGTLLTDYAGSPAKARQKIDAWWKGGAFERKGDGRMTVTLLP